MSPSSTSSMLRFLVVVLCISGVVSVASPARAQATAPTQGNAAEAQKQFDEGLRFYNIGEYDRAAEAFRSAYLLHNLPRYLFSMGQSYRMKGDCVKAIDVLENYRRSEASEENRQAADQLIEQAQDCAEKQKQDAAAARKAAEATPTPATTPVTPDEPSRWKTWMPWIVTGVGGALVGTGIILAVSAASNYNSLQQECGDHCDPARWAGLDTREKLGYALLISGAAATVGGLTWWYIGSRQQSAQVAWIAPTLGGVRMGSTF